MGGGGGCLVAETLYYGILVIDGGGGGCLVAETLYYGILVIDVGGGGGGENAW